MKCSKCGTDNPSGKSVCSKCGNFLYSAEPRNRVPLTRAQRRERRKTLIKNTFSGCLWTGLVLLAMLIVLSLVSFLLVRYILPDEYIDSLVRTTASDTLVPGQDDTGSDG